MSPFPPALTDARLTFAVPVATLKVLIVISFRSVVPSVVTLVATTSPTALTVTEPSAALIAVSVIVLALVMLIFPASVVAKSTLLTLVLRAMPLPASAVRTVVVITPCVCAILPALAVSITESGAVRPELVSVISPPLIPAVMTISPVAAVTVKEASTSPVILPSFTVPSVTAPSVVAPELTVMVLIVVTEPLSVISRAAAMVMVSADTV